MTRYTPVRYWGNTWGARGSVFALELEASYVELDRREAVARFWTILIWRELVLEALAKRLTALSLPFIRGPFGSIF